MDTEDPPLGEGGPSEFENMKDRKISLPSFSNGIIFVNAYTIAFVFI